MLDLSANDDTIRSWFESGHGVFPRFELDLLAVNPQIDRIARLQLLGSATSDRHMWTSL
jgi:hypothetical protein